MSGRIKTFALAVATACTVAVIAPSEGSARHHKNSNNGDSPVSMQLFPIKRGYDGAEFIVTPAGYTISIPGLGVAPNATQLAVYEDDQRNYWYIDRDGNSVKLTTDQIQWIQAQLNQQAQARGVMPPIIETNSAQQPVQNVVVQQQPSQGSGLGNTLVNGLAAAGGAMAGAALGSSLYHNNYNGIPYGVPVYHHGGKYYYNGSNGKKVYVNNSTYVNQWNHQNNWQNMQHNHPTQLPANGYHPTNGNRPNNGSRPNNGYHPNNGAQFPSAGSNHQRPSFQGHPQQMPAVHPSHHVATSGSRSGGARFSGGGASRGARGGGRRR